MSLAALFFASLTVTSTGGAIGDFLDEVVPAAMAEHHVPGAIVAVVHDGAVVVRGYGQADRNANVAVDSEQTRFRVGSLSKLITATAVMRLVRARKLDLDQDVSAFLGGVELERCFPGDVTLTALLTHTSGFANTDILDATYDLGDVEPLTTFVQNRMTPQVVAPGRYHEYTNHGFTLLGQLIAQTTKEPFPAAVRSLVFDPLGMTQSTFEQKAPDSWHSSIAVGYERVGEDYRALPLDFSHVAPADALVTTARDMARFMSAHLGDGELDVAMLREMHRTHFTHHPTLAGHALGFQTEQFGRHRREYGARRALSHTGGQLGFTSELVLVPEQKLGIFICLNRRVGPARRKVVRAYFERFLPFSAPRAAEVGPPAEAERYVGRYLRRGLPRHTMEAVVYLLDPGAVLEVGVAVDGDLSLGRLGTFTSSTGDILVTRDGTKRVAARFGPGGPATHLYDELVAYERVSKLADPELHRLVLLATLAVFMAVFFAAPIRRMRGRPSHPLHRWMGIVAGLDLAFVFAFGFAIVQALGKGWDYGVPWTLTATLYVPVAGAAATLFLAVATARTKSPAPRAKALIVVLASAAFLVVLGYWNLIGT